jgi:hypothetical protein
MVSAQPEVKSTYVFILTDTMSSRKEIFKNCLKYSFNTDLVIETRMSINKGRVYAFDPNNPVEVEEWEKTLYDDKDAEVSVCGASASIIPTVYNLASRAVWRLLHHFDKKYGKDYLKGDAASSPDILSELQFVLPEFVSADGDHYDHMYRQFKKM